MAVRALEAPRAARTGRTPAWVVVTGQELRDLWLAGRGLPLAIAFSCLVSIIAYLVATNRALNFLEQREAVNLTLQVAIAVGALLTLLAGADAISGERERGTLESLLLTPASRRDLVVGKLCAALSLWFVAFAITIPYVWFLGRGIGLVGDALATGFVVGTTLSLFLASLGLIVSLFATSNRVSLSASLFLLLALFAPTQLPASAQKGWAGELLLRVNPVTAGEHYVGKIVTNGHPWRDDVSWLISPFVAAAVFTAAAVLLGARFLRLRGGRST
jgi:ABC-2 type transport system permease protein